MLSFYNHKIYFYFELNDTDDFHATSLPYCSLSDIRNLFPNVTTFTSMEKANLANKDVDTIRFLFSPAEFRGFVDAWVNHCNVQKLYNWDGAVFFIEYIKTLKEIAKIDADYQFDGRWEGDDGLYDEEKIELLNNIDVSKMVESPIKINSMCELEISMKIEDALYAVKNKTTSLYTNEINDLIQYNIRKMGLTKALYENFAGNPSIMVPDISLDQSLTIDKIDYSNPNCIFYFYYYSFLPGIKTNLVHLRRVLQEMRK